MPMTPDSESKADSEIAGHVLEIGARLELGPSQTLIDTAFRRELEDQLSLFDILSQVDLAHTLVMAESGIIPQNEAHSLLIALKQLQRKPPDFHPEPSIGDLYTNREAWLTAKSHAGIWLGAGRARREAITTAYVMKQREQLIELSESLIGFAKTLTGIAEIHQSSLMSDYTYWQSAQPTSFGHYLLGFAYPVLRDIERIQGLYSRLNKSPAGCGSSNGSRLPQSRVRLASLLGFESLTSHARDAMWQADIQIEVVAVLTAILVNLDRLAEDLQIFASDEFGLIELDDRHSRASKIMPQKKNPFALTYIRGLANTMIGTLTGCAALGRTPSGQPDNRLALYGAVPKALNDTRNAVVLMSEVVFSMKFNRKRAREKLDSSFAMATDLADILVLETHLSFREAHRLVGNLVRSHIDSGSFKNLTCNELSDTATVLLGREIKMSPSALNQALNPESAIAARHQPGGAANSAMHDMIEECRHTLATAAELAKHRKSLLEKAALLLDESISAYLSTTLTVAE